jgi:ubiquinone/menaquinone biosynthesis C-methylase UbiE
MKRVVTPELLDEDLGTPEEIRGTLLDLREINQNFGGFESVAALLRIVAKRSAARSLNFLDVAGGSGDVADYAARHLSIEGIHIRAVVLDRAVSHMNGSGFEMNKVAGDATAIPFQGDSFDVVGCNLFCHHLEPGELIAFFNEALRVGKLAVIASDLRRNLFHWIAAHAGCVIYRSRLTRNDAPVSVRRAYTIEEMDQIASRTASAGHEIAPHFFQRFGLILWKVKP